MDKLFISALAGVFFASTATSATEDIDLFSLSLEELMHEEIYSASKSYRAIEDVPASVIIVTRKDIERMGYMTLDEILQHVPGFYLIDNYENQLIGVRGSIGGSLAFLVNGVLHHPSRVPTQTSVDRGRMNIPVESIDRIEIVRGPQAVTYGNSAFYGSINVITNDASNGSQVSVSAGDNEQGRAFARATHEYDDGSAVFNAGYWKTDGIGGDLVDTMDPASYAALDPAMHKSLDGLLSHENYNLDFSGSFKNFYSNLRYSQMDYGFYALTPSFDKGNQLLLTDRQLALGYEDDFNSQWSYKIDYTYSHQSYDINPFDFITANFGATQFQYSKRQAFDAHSRYQPNNKLSILFGIWYQDIESENNVNIPTFLSKMDSTDEYTYKDVYTQLDYSPIDTLDLGLGVRYHHVDSYTSLLDDGSTQTSEFARSTDAYLPQLSAVYHINTRDRLKLLYGKANQRPRISGINLQDEVIESIEFQYLYSRENILVNSSLFFNQIDNLQRVTQSIENGSIVKTSDNSGQLEIFGLELILKHNITSQFYYNASLTWQSSKDHSNPAIEPGYSPKLIAKADTSYKLNRYIFSILAEYVDAMKADWQFSDTVLGEINRIGNDVDAYINLGANVRYDFANDAYINLKVSNLLDKNIRYPATELVDFAGGGFGQGRHFLATLGYKF